jgi:hypothetical protein
MKILSVKTTQLPTGERIQWVSGMPQHPYKAMDSELFNRWGLHIHNELLKTRGWNKVINRIKEGGVCYSDGQESALKLAKEILG